MKKKIIRIAVLAVIAAVLLVLRFNIDNVFVKLFSMIFLVLFCESLLTFVLGLIKLSNHRAQTLVTIIASLCKYVAAIVILCWGLSILGVDVTGILASVGVLTLVVGFSAESLIADVITGTFMLFENQYNVGDIVEVGGFRGTVCEIGIRTTSIMDVGGNIKIVNNSDMKNILNRSDRVSIAASTIDVPYETDFEKLEAQIPALMEEIYQKNGEKFLAAPRYLGIQELGASGVTLKFVADVKEHDIYNGVRTLNHDLLLGFKKLGVECPFPQVDVHNK